MISRALPLGGVTQYADLVNVILIKDTTQTVIKQLANVSVEKTVINL